LLNKPKVAYRDEILLFWLPTCSGISYSSAEHITFGLRVPSPQKIRRCGAGGNLLLLRRTPRTLVTPLVVSVAEGRGPDAGRSAGRHVQSRSPLTNGGDCRRSSNQMLNPAAATALADGSSVPSPPNKLYAPDLENVGHLPPPPDIWSRT